MSVTIQVPIPDELIPALETRARNAGLERDAYVQALVARDLEGLRRLDEILAEFRSDVERSESSDGDLDELFDQAIKESRANR